MEKYKITPLVWDSDYFKCRCIRLDIIEELNDGEFDIVADEIQSSDFITITNLRKLHNNNKRICERLKAYLVDVNVTLEIQKRQSLVNNTVKTCLKIVSVKDMQSIEDILCLASTSFENTRFYNDKKIQNDMAGKIYVNWIKNSLNHENKYFSIFELDEHVVGFILFSQNEDENWVIELVAVDKEYRNMKIGKTLMQNIFNFERIKEGTFIYVGTQIENINALNYYVSNGFRVKEIMYIYHLWNI